MTAHPVARYGNRRVPKMLDEWRSFRDACRDEGTPAIQDGLDKVEQWIDWAFQKHGERE